ncbi:MAG: site-specific integrase [Muribaculaceae bacterium]|nr:site-specific integrase [Muribaculaceae bacterium]
MAKTKFFLDTRRTKPGSPSVLKVAIGHRDKTSYISLEAHLLPEQWDDEHSMVVNHPEQQLLNLYINGVKQHVGRTIIILADSGELHSMTATDIKKEIERRLNPGKIEAREQAQRRKNLFATRFIAFADSKKPSTREVYMHTYKRMVAYVGEQQLHKLAFEDITKEWLTKFDVFMMPTAPSKNSRNIHLRNIRAVFNEAIDDEITTFYPFRRFKIRPVATPKRNLKIDDLRLLWNYPCEAHAVKYLDMFKLMFMLIGINSIDLCHLTEIREGRVEFHRSKTNRLYSIKVEPEALEIINKYRGKDYLLDILDRWKSHKDFTLKMNRTLKRIGPVKRSGLGGKKTYDPLFPQISTYWARHSWATIAASLDIPRDTIAHALGHGGNTVTDIYIDFDQSKVDEANRRVLDWVLYGKK